MKRLLLLAALLLSNSAFAANTSLSNLSAGAAVSSTDLFYNVQSGGSGGVKTTAAQVKTFTSASPTLVTPTLGVAGGTSLALGGCTISTNAFCVTGTTALAATTITTSFTATGLVTNADLANPATTVNGQTCTLGSTCTVAAAAGTLTGTTLAAGVTASSLTSVGTLTGGATGAGFTIAVGTSTVSGTMPVANLGGSAASHAVPVDVAGTSTWKVVPDCTDTGGNHINFTQSTDAFSCGTSGGGASLTVGTTAIASGTDTRVFFQDGASPTGVLQQSPYMLFDKNSGILTLQGGLALNPQTAQILDFNGNNLLNAYGSNIFMGTSSGNMTTTGNSNIGLGTSTVTVLTSGLYNMAIGAFALTAVTSSSENVGVGAGALRAVTTGAGGSVGIGSNAGSTITTGVKNICIGYHACDSLTTGANNVVIGGVTTLSAGTASVIIFGDGAGNAKADFNFTTASNWTFTGPMAITGVANVATTSALCYNTSSGLITYNATVGTCTVSALRFKDVIGSLESERSLALLHPSVWTYKPDSGFADERVHVGLLADDVEKMDVRCAVYDVGGVLTNYEDRCIIAYLVKEMVALREAIRR